MNKRLYDDDMEWMSFVDEEPPVQEKGVKPKEGEKPGEKKVEDKEKP